MDLRDLRINLGAGSTILEGYTPWDIRSGGLAYPFAFRDNSVAEIRASHVLEHLPFDTAHKALADWFRALKPGGVVRIAVPDTDKINSPEFANHPLRLRFLMGGQTDPNDFHLSAWTRESLTDALLKVGFEVYDDPWVSEIEDCASYPISLNVRAAKPDATPMRICALTTVPRFGYQDHFACIYRALAPMGIDLKYCGGVYWDKGIQALCEDAIAEGFDWALTLDFDSIFNSHDVSMMLECFANNPHVDALAPMQAQRGSGKFLAGISGASENAMEMIVSPYEPFRVDTAHFGMTLLRLDSFAKVQKPWFIHKPNAEGTYRKGAIDADVNFWHKWKAAGNNLSILPACVIGQLEEVCIWSKLDGTVMRAPTNEFLKLSHTERMGVAA